MRLQPADMPSVAGTRFRRVMILADAIETATWGLVVVTAILVFATAVPAVQRAQETRFASRAGSARLVPDMHMMRSRLNGLAERARGNRKPDDAFFKEAHRNVTALLKMVASMMGNAPLQGLEFTNEMYVLRHLLTQAYDLCHEGADALSSGKDGRTELDALYNRVAAAKITLDHAEALLPKRTTTIGGERFWDRFSRVSEERIETAGRTKQADLGR